MKSKATALQQSILDRLRNIAREQGQAFERVLTYYGIERFLYRLSQSKYRNLFILKGALLMKTWPQGLERATRDIDFRAYSNPDLEEVTQILQEICAQPFENDGMVFNPKSLEVDSIVERAEYPGVRAKLWGKVGEARVRIRLDLGFSDPVTAEPDWVDYPTLLEMPAPKLRAYPRATVVAEKLEAIAQLGEVNSRMKDFFDLYNMARMFHFDEKLLAECVRSTFNARGTLIPEDVPAGLTDDFARANQSRWTAFLRRIGQEREEIASFQNIVRLLRDFAIPIFKTVL